MAVHETISNNVDVGEIQGRGTRFQFHTGSIKRSDEHIVIETGSEWKDITGKVFTLTGFDTREDTVTLTCEWDCILEIGTETRTLKSLAYITKYYEKVYKP